MRKTLIAIGIFVLVSVVAIWYFSNIFFYITMSLVIATLLRPLTNKINKFEVFNRGIPRVVAVLCSFALVVTVFGAFITLFIPLISHQIDIISDLDFELVFDKLFEPIINIEHFLINKDLVDEEAGFLKSEIHDILFKYAGRMHVGEIINSLFSVAGNLFVGVMAIAFITFFLLYEKGIIRRMIISIIPNQYFEVFISALYKMERLLSNYLLGLLFQMISIFSIASLGLTILGVDYAVTIAVFAAVANLIPYLGPILGATFGVLVAVSTTGDFTFSNDTIWLIIKVCSVFGIVQVTDNVLLQPLIFSKSVKAHPLEIFVIIFVGASIAGITGMIAAIPVYTIVRVSASEIYAGFNQYKVFKIKN